ncbi:MAG: hypothetical protein V8T01_05385 [Oscillospiraceae bacterium]
MDEILLSVEHLTHRFPRSRLTVRALDDLSFSAGTARSSAWSASPAPENRRRALRHESLTGRRRAAFFHGIDVTDRAQRAQNRRLSAAARQIIFQDSDVEPQSPRMTVSSHLAEPLRIARRATPRAIPRRGRVGS